MRLTSTWDVLGNPVLKTLCAVQVSFPEWISSVCTEIMNLIVTVTLREEGGIRT